MTEAVVFFDCALSKWYEDDSTSTASITAIYASTGSDDFTVFIFPASQRISDVASSVTGLHLEYGQMHLAYMRGGPYEPVPAVPEKEGLAEFAEFLAKHGKDLTLLAHNAPSIQCLVDAIFRSDLKTQMVFRTLIRELVTAAPDIRHHLKLGPLDWDTSDNQATIAQLGRDFKVPRREDEFLPAYRVRVLRHVIDELGIDSFPRGQRQQLQLAPLDLDTQIKIVLEQIMGRSGITKKTE